MHPTPFLMPPGHFWGLFAFWMSMWGFLLARAMNLYSEVCLLNGTVLVVICVCPQQQTHPNLYRLAFLRLPWSQAK